MKVFIAGPRIVGEIDRNIILKLENICDKNYEILIGDAEGIDSCVQKFLQFKLYRNVIVFASKGIARNNYGDWKIEKVEVSNQVTGFEFYAQKDLQMAKKADIGFMIWNGKSKGTFNNIMNLLEFDKQVVLYYLPNQKFYYFKKKDELKEFLVTNVKLDSKLKKLLSEKEIKSFFQTCLF